MSVTIPTAEVRTPQPPSPRRRWPAWLLAGLLGAAIGVLATSDERLESPETDPVPVPVELDVVETTAVSDTLLEFSSPVLFPGDGAFDSMASSIHGSVGIGHRSVTAGAFVWTADPGLAEWTRRHIEVGERAALSDVTAYMDGFLVGGAIVGPGMGSAVPTLWFGTASSDLVVLDHPYPGPGRVGGVHVIRGSVFVVCQSPFTDPLARGAARAGRLLVGRPGAWDDITPPGANVVVSAVVGFGDGIVASGGDVDGAKLWWRPSPASDWAGVELGDGVVTDLVVPDSRTLLASVRTWDSDGTIRSQLYEGSSPRAMAALGATLRRDVGWIAPTGDAVIGGARSGTTGRPTLWKLVDGESWEPVYLGGDDGTVRGVGGSSADRFVLGTVEGQPAVWRMDSAFEPMILVERIDRAWEAVTRLPAGADTVVDIGRHLVAAGSTRDQGVMWVWDGRVWSEVPVGEEFTPTGFFEDQLGVVLFGNRRGDGVIRTHPAVDISIDDLAGVTIRHVVRSERGFVVLGDTDSGPVRVAVEDGRLGPVAELDRLPVRIFEHEGMLIGMGHERPIQEWAVSTDVGATWLDIDQPAFTIGVASGRVVVVTADTPRRVLALDAATLDLEPVELVSESFFDAAASPGASLMGWADGVAASGASFVRVWPDLTGEPVQLPTGVEHGLDGAFRSLVPGPGGYALASQHGGLMVYRWLGSGS